MVPVRALLCAVALVVAASARAAPISFVAEGVANADVFFSTGVPFNAQGEYDMTSQTGGAEALTYAYGSLRTLPDDSQSSGGGFTFGGPGGYVFAFAYARTAGDLGDGRFVEGIWFLESAQGIYRDTSDPLYEASHGTYRLELSNPRPIGPVRALYDARRIVSGTVSVVPEPVSLLALGLRFLGCRVRPRRGRALRR